MFEFLQIYRLTNGLRLLTYLRFGVGVRGFGGMFPGLPFPGGRIVFLGGTSGAAGLISL